MNNDFYNLTNKLASVALYFFAFALARNLKYRIHSPLQL